MLVHLPHNDWQVLRALVCAEAAGENPTGRELRITPSRRSKDGTFLDELVAAGLLAVAGKPGPAHEPDPVPKMGPAPPPEPAQFRTRYRLTDLGRHAAEYGEYERPFTPRADAPLTGLAAEYLGPIIARAGRWRQPPGVDGRNGAKKPAPRKGKW